ncbi:hypothetical protein [Halorubrum lacusprofundi]|jgi:hypothetical protein|uniref:hypothetical protein n=1 Tax=Halorubrum lacusprofundi TaxID=2247 RepID=UPI001F37949C|nr:hypothetical protein [Halorubrum lacusprofundi]MCG1006578.1 hypothetical protein [Halorubrum lacusprofundi]
MTQLTQMIIRADETGTLELVCERSTADQTEPDVRAFFGKNEFGLLVDGLEPNERVALLFEGDLKELPDSTKIEPPNT